MSLFRLRMREIDPAAGSLPSLSDQNDPPERKRFGWMQIGPVKLLETMIRTLESQFQRREAEVDRSWPAVAEVQASLSEHWRLHRNGASGIGRRITAA